MSEQKYLIYSCLISGVESKALAPKETIEHIRIPCIHPVLTTDIDSLLDLTKELDSIGELNHLHLCAWLVKLSQLPNPLILDIDFLADRVPNLGEPFATFLVPKLQSIYVDLFNNAHIRESKTYTFPKLRLNAINTAELSKDSRAIESSELIKRSLVAWTKRVLDTLELAKGIVTAKPLKEVEDPTLKYIKIDERINSTKRNRQLRHLGSYLKSCLNNRVMASELSTALDALFYIKETPTVQILHLRELVLTYGLENFTDQKLSYDAILSLISKELASRDGISSLLGLEPVQKKADIQASKTKFKLEIEEKEPTAKPNLMLLALQKQRQNNG